MSEEFLDEVTSINSIYGATTLRPIPDGDEGHYTLTHPSHPSVTLRLAFPADYPDAPPAVLGTQSVGGDAVKGEGTQLVEAIRHVLADVYTPGAPCVFDVVEESRARIERLKRDASTGGGGAAGGAGAQDAEGGESTGKDDRRGLKGDGADGCRKGVGNDEDDGSVLGRGEEPPWVLSEVVAEKKSVFVARAAGVDSVEMAKGYLGHLLGTDRKVAKATHNITAWRIRGENGVQFQDCDDDGETAAGGRVLHLLELMGVWNAMVVVTRWYGGVQLGPDRFRIINQTARDAIVKGGFSQEPQSKDTSGKKKGKKG